MMTALATSHDRMAPCFAGVDVLLVPEDGDLAAARIIPTQGWHPLSWGRHLMQYDVGLLLCSGVDLATRAAIQGHGIDVVADAMGAPTAVLAAWRSGRLAPVSSWPPEAGQAAGGDSTRRSHRGTG